MFVTNWISTTKIQKISEITNFFRHYFLSRTEVLLLVESELVEKISTNCLICLIVFIFQHFKFSIKRAYLLK